MRTNSAIKTLFVTATCLVWWHCCFCDSSSIKQTLEIQRNVADLHSGPNPNLQNEERNKKENLEVVNKNQVSDTGQDKATSHVNIVKKSKSGSEEVKSTGHSTDAEVKSKSQSPLKNSKVVDELTRKESTTELGHKKVKVSSDIIAENSAGREGVKLPSVEQNLSTSRESSSGSLTDKTQLKSVPQPESLVLEDSITPPLTASVSDHGATVHHDSVLPSHHSSESQMKEKVGETSVADEIGGDSDLHQQHPHSEAMPSFDEWKKMMLAEQEKEGLKIPSVPPGKKIASQKRKRNYASYECGAKIVGSNSESEGTSRILNELVDEYMLNPCKAKIWFVIELCETVQALQIELANFELFSSCPKDFAVYSSDHYPTRDWTLLGTFTAAEQRVLQSFELKQEGYGKFIKIELLSYYGKEHYCPLSVMRIFGTSMVEEYEEMETGGSIQSISEDDEDRLDVEYNVEDVSPGNIFGSAKDAVLSMVKKAAQVLGRDQATEGDSINITEHQNMSEEDVCKLFPGSSERCQNPNATTLDASVTDVDTSAPDLPIPYSPLHQALFYYLHNCETCIIDSHDENLTSAQPTCRFFQAALGPVLFKGICELFRENRIDPVVTPGPTDTAGSHLLQKDATRMSPKHSTSISPPPQIISVIIDGAVESKSLPAYSDSIPTSPVPSQDFSTSALLEEISSFPAPKVEERPVNQLEIESIQPTKAFQSDTKVEEEWSPSSSLTEVSPKVVGETVEGGVTDVVQPSISDVKITATPTDQATPSSPSSVSSESSFITSGESIPVSEGSGFTISEKPLEMDAPLHKSTNDSVPKVSSVKYEDSTLFTEPAAFTPEDFSEAFQSQPSGMHDISKEEKDSALMGSVLSATTGQKESVFMRMSNRIKSLELNMSLSSQYLQELSQRYRRQMEEMQRAFNRTIGTLNDTARKAAERDVKQQEVISSLQSQVGNLTHAVDLLIVEKEGLYSKMIETHVFLMVIEAIVMITILSLCARRISSKITAELHDVHMGAFHPQNIIRRRNSLESSMSPTSRKMLKRSCSEEVLRRTAVQECTALRPKSSYY